MTTQWFSYSMYINPIGPDRRQIMRKCYSFFRAHTDTFIIWNLDKIIYFVLMQHNYDHDWLLFISPNLVFLYNLLQRTTNLPVWKKTHQTSHEMHRNQGLCFNYYNSLIDWTLFILKLLLNKFYNLSYYVPFFYYWSCPFRDRKDRT